MAAAATLPSEQLSRDLQDVWNDALKSYEELKNKGKLGDAHWKILVAHTTPAELLKSLEAAPYKTKEVSGLVKLARGSVDTVERFDKELSALASGASSQAFGVPNVAWAGLRFVVHVAKDLYSTPGLILEIVAKIFVFMPRIEVYWELFSDQKDILDIRGLLLDIYKSIISFNVDSVTWFATSRIGKIGRTFAADPRQRFQELLVKMTDMSEEIRKRAEAIAFKIQVTRHKEMIEEFRTRDEEQQRRMEQLIDLIARIHVSETTEPERRIEKMKAAEERKNKAETQKAEEKRVYEAAMQPYRDFEEVRIAFWIILHRPPFTMVHETFLEESHSHTGLSVTALARSWKTGEFTTSFPPGDDLAHITVLVDWKPEEDPKTPRLRWMIQAPNSLYYPGDHFGCFELRHRTAFNERPVGAFKPYNTRLRVRWMSPIFSPFPNSAGAISSVGPLEESSAHTILTPTLHSIAHALVHGPFASIKAPVFRLHEMGFTEARYFLKTADGRSRDEEKCMRATALFANAFNRSSHDNLGALDFLGLPGQCREISVIAIRELLEFYDISAQVGEKALGDSTWQLEDSCDNVTTQREWVAFDRLWAIRIAELAKFEFILKAAKEQASVMEAWTSSGQPNESLATSKPTDTPKPVVGSRIAGIARNRPDGMPNCLADDGLPWDWTDLHRAIWHQDCIATHLLADNISVHQKDDIGYTPLHLACSNTSSLLFKSRQLRDRGLSGDKRSLQCLPFRESSEAAAVEMARTLLAAGADPNVEAWPARSEEQKKLPWTPMHCAANSGWMDVAFLLLEHGGSAFSRTMCSPFCWADDGYKLSPLGVSRGEPSTMRELLGSHLSSEQVNAINALHHEQTGATGGLVYPVFPAQAEE